MNQKGNTLIIGILIGLLIAGGLFSVYYFGISKKEQGAQLSNKQQASEVVQTPTSSPSLSGTVFKINEIKVGDKIGQMTVKSVEPFEPKVSMSENNFKITFSGQITITGNYEFVDLTETGTGGKFVRFVPDSLSAILLPQEAVAGQSEDNRDFVFNNYNQAAELLTSKGNNGSAKVVIDNYTLVSYPTEINNSAELLRVE